MTNSQTCKETRARVRLWPSTGVFSWQHKDRIRQITTKRYQQRILAWNGYPYYETVMKKSDALKWIYQNCRNRYTISHACEPVDGTFPTGFGRTMYYCDFDRESDAVAFRLIFSDIIAEL